MRLRPRRVAWFTPSWRATMWTETVKTLGRELLLSSSLGSFVFATHLPAMVARRDAMRLLRCEGGENDAVLMVDDEIAFYVRGPNGPDLRVSAVDRIVKQGFDAQRLAYGRAFWQGPGSDWNQRAANDARDAAGNVTVAGSALLLVTSDAWKVARESGFKWEAQDVEDVAFCRHMVARGWTLHPVSGIAVAHNSAWRPPLVCNGPEEET